MIVAVASNVGLEVNAEKTTYMVMFRDKYAG
jgi:hypothetical protein